MQEHRGPRNTDQVQVFFRDSFQLCNLPLELLGEEGGHFSLAALPRDPGAEQCGSVPREKTVPKQDCPGGLKLPRDLLSPTLGTSALSGSPPHLLGGDVEVWLVGQGHLGESRLVTAAGPLVGPCAPPGPPGTHLEAAPVLLDEVVVHCAHRPPVLVQHLRLPTGTMDSVGSLPEAPPGPTGAPPWETSPRALPGASPWNTRPPALPGVSPWAPPPVPHQLAARPSPRRSVPGAC